MQDLYIPMLSIHPGKLVHYSEPLNPRTRSRRKKNPYAVKPDRTKEIAMRQRKRMTHAVTLLHDLSKKKRVFNASSGKWFSFHLNFITLTIPGMQKHTDREYHKQVFEPFMRYLRGKYNTLLYVWVCETQANGNLHYHMVTNTYIDHKELRNTWNYYNYKAGYQDHHNPNSTDVKAIIGMQNAQAYIAKYLGKESKDRRIPDLKKWDSSMVLKKYKAIKIEMVSNTGNDVNAIREECRYLRNKYKSVKKYDYCTIQNTTKAMLRECPILSKLYFSALIELMAQSAHSDYPASLAYG